jgi:hypothetical protein
MTGDLNCPRISRLFHELAEAFADDQPAPEPKSRPRRRRAPRSIVRPAGESDELARRAAQNVLRKHGFEPR